MAVREVLVGESRPHVRDARDAGDLQPAVPRDQAVLAIPTSALLRTSEGTFVYAINGDTYLRTAVKVGSEADNWVEITDGLPYVFGVNNGVHISEVDFIIEGDNQPAPVLPNPPASEVDIAVGKLIAAEI